MLKLIYLFLLIPLLSVAQKETQEANPVYFDTLLEQGREGPITWKFIHDRIDSSTWNVGISLYINKGYWVYGPDQPTEWIDNQPIMPFIDLDGKGQNKYRLMDPIISRGERKVENKVVDVYKGIVPVGESRCKQWYFTDSCRFVYKIVAHPDAMKDAYLGIIFQWCDSTQPYHYREWYYKLIPTKKL